MLYCCVGVLLFYCCEVLGQLQGFLVGTFDRLVNNQDMDSGNKVASYSDGFAARLCVRPFTNSIHSIINFYSVSKPSCQF